MEAGEPTRPTGDFESSIGSALERSAHALDPAVTDRLQRIRREAVARTRRQSGIAAWLQTLLRSDPPTWTLPAGAFASVAVTAVALVVLARGPEAGSPDDFELLSSIDDLELIEDLEFYQALEVLEAERAG